ncbi:hypothetical protein Q8A67_008129 [Cirrhinus molitorella]|uniref:Uncharacterized protein n=1 Tax=Cirrhinus molitorella TaxID=172907 RepID=A0AA88TU71_9TELE|nr:hypothetical protein Q8A67_008129 [Cirrhinus molitorella]
MTLHSVPVFKWFTPCQDPPHASPMVLTRPPITSHVPPSSKMDFTQGRPHIPLWPVSTHIYIPFPVSSSELLLSPQPRNSSRSTVKPNGHFAAKPASCSTVRKERTPVVEVQPDDDLQPVHLHQPSGRAARDTVVEYHFT